VSTTGDGRFAFTTVMPGRVPGPDGRWQAPHLLVSVLARGILTRLATRIYFEDEPGNADDPVLGLVPDERRGTLVARRAEPNRYVFDVVLQGPGETVFFDV
jgi:protocatechuate 3,4-dioxygenase alpha subunit